MSWNPDAIDQAVDQKMGGGAAAADPPNPAAPAPVTAQPVAPVPAPAPAVQSDPAQPAPAPVVDAPAPAPAAPEAQPDAPAPQPAPDAPAEEVVDEAAYRTAIERVGGLEELDWLEKVGKPLIAPVIDADGFMNAVEENRGTDGLSRLAWGFFDRHITDYVDELLSPRFDPNQIEDPTTRGRVARMREAALGGAPRPAAPAAAPVTPPPSRADLAAASGLPALNPDDYDELPKPILDFIAAAQARDGQIKTIEERLAELDRYREQERERLRLESQTAVWQQAGQRAHALATEIKGEIDKEITVVSFSTAVDPAAAKAENDDITADIEARLNDYTDTDPAFTRLYDEARAKYIAGDKLGAREQVRTLKTLARTFVKQRIAARGGKVKAAVAAGAPPVTANPSQRVVISGPGSGAASTIPATPPPGSGGKAWENLDQQIDSKLSKLNPAAPVG